MYHKLDPEYFCSDDVVALARDLLGKVLVHDHPDGNTSGIIVETEAYRGIDDKACHAFGRRTPRTEIMYGPGGFAYVYLCYGIHHLFNVVTNVEGMADAILIRALEPVHGQALMKERTGKSIRMTSGPGLLSKAMGITTDMNGFNLQVGDLWIGSMNKQVHPGDITCTKRIGVEYAGEDAKLLWRFYLTKNPWVSRK